MAHIFHGCAAFNQPLNWDMTKAEKIDQILNGASSFNQLNFLQKSGQITLAPMLRF
jgi:hypothetical protein